MTNDSILSQLSDLSGSDKQRSWAFDIRESMLKQALQVASSVEDQKLILKIAKFTFSQINKKSSKFFIENFRSSSRTFHKLILEKFSLTHSNVERSDSFLSVLENYIQEVNEKKEAKDRIKTREDMKNYLLGFQSKKAYSSSEIHQHKDLVEELHTYLLDSQDKISRGENAVGCDEFSIDSRIKAFNNRQDFFSIGKAEIVKSPERKISRADFDSLEDYLEFCEDAGWIKETERYAHVPEKFLSRM